MSIDYLNCIWESKLSFFTFLMYFWLLLNSERTHLLFESVQATELSIRTAERLTQQATDRVKLLWTCDPLFPWPLIYVTENDKMATQQSVFTSASAEEGLEGRGVGGGGGRAGGGARRPLTLIHVIVGHDGDALLPHHADVSPVAVARPQEHG